MDPLAKPLRRQLEDAVVKARHLAEQAAQAALLDLGIGDADAPQHLTDTERALRRRLRAHGRQLGDQRAPNGAQAIEHQRALERLLANLAPETFHASDGLGWVYQLWQTKQKDRVNASEVKIGADELPAVTQLFTEPYLVAFLLDNSLGAWWAAHRLSDEDRLSAETEEALRRKAAIPGVPLEYLRFVRDCVVRASSPDSSGQDGLTTHPHPHPHPHPQPQTQTQGPWTPAAGTFNAWPKHLGELKVIDPCCGSGHFLVAALQMLVPMRMALEGLDARAAIDAVLRDNLHGLELD